MIPLARVEPTPKNLTEEQQVQIAEIVERLKNKYAKFFEDRIDEGVPKEKIPSLFMKGKWFDKDTTIGEYIFRNMTTQASFGKLKTGMIKSTKKAKTGLSFEQLLLEIPYRVTINEIFANVRVEIVILLDSNHIDDDVTIKPQFEKTETWPRLTLLINPQNENKFVVINNEKYKFVSVNKILSRAKVSDRDFRFNIQGYFKKDFTRAILDVILYKLTVKSLDGFKYAVIDVPPLCVELKFHGTSVIPYIFEVYGKYYKLRELVFSEYALDYLEHSPQTQKTYFKESIKKVSFIKHRSQSLVKNIGLFENVKTLHIEVLRRFPNNVDFGKFKSLEKLTVFFTKAKKIEIKNCKILKYVEILPMNLDISSLGAVIISQCPQLIGVNCENVKTLEFVNECRSLRKLAVVNVNTITSFGKIPNLKTLRFGVKTIDNLTEFLDLIVRDVRYLNVLNIVFDPDEDTPIDVIIDKVEFNQLKTFRFWNNGFGKCNLQINGASQLEYVGFFTFEKSSLKLSKCPRINYVYLQTELEFLNTDAYPQIFVYDALNKEFVLRGRGNVTFVKRKRPQEQLPRKRSKQSGKYDQTYDNLEKMKNEEIKDKKNIALNDIIDLAKANTSVEVVFARKMFPLMNFLEKDKQLQVLLNWFNRNFVVDTRIKHFIEDYLFVKYLVYYRENILEGGMEIDDDIEMLKPSEFDKDIDDEYARMQRDLEERFRSQRMQLNGNSSFVNRGFNPKELFTGGKPISQFTNVPIGWKQDAERTLHVLWWLFDVLPKFMVLNRKDPEFMMLSRNDPRFIRRYYKTIFFEQIVRNFKCENIETDGLRQKKFKLCKDNNNNEYFVNKIDIQKDMVEKRDFVKYDYLREMIVGVLLSKGYNTVTWRNRSYPICGQFNRTYYITTDVHRTAIYQITEYIPHTLKEFFINYVKNYNNRDITAFVVVIKDVMMQLIYGLYYLNKKYGGEHRDLHLKNIMIRELSGVPMTFVYSERFVCQIKNAKLLVKIIDFDRVLLPFDDIFLNENMEWYEREKVYGIFGKFRNYKEMQKKGDDDLQKSQDLDRAFQTMMAEISISCGNSGKNYLFNKLLNKFRELKSDLKSLNFLNENEMFAFIRTHFSEYCKDPNIFGNYDDLRVNDNYTYVYSDKEKSTDGPDFLESEKLIYY